MIDQGPEACAGTTAGISPLHPSPRFATIPFPPVRTSETRMRFLSLPMLLIASASFAADRPVVRSANSGPWEKAGTWADGKLPSPGDVVLIRPGHRVTYASNSDKPYRAVHVGGTLAFDSDRDTLIAVGLLKIQPGESCVEDG